MCIKQGASHGTVCLRVFVNARICCILLVVVWWLSYATVVHALDSTLVQVVWDNRHYRQAARLTVWFDNKYQCKNKTTNKKKNAIVVCDALCAFLAGDSSWFWGTAYCASGFSWHPESSARGINLLQSLDESNHVLFVCIVSSSASPVSMYRDWQRQYWKGTTLAAR